MSQTAGDSATRDALKRDRGLIFAMEQMCSVNVHTQESKHLSTIPLEQQLQSKEVPLLQNYT